MWLILVNDMQTATHEAKDPQRADTHEKQFSDHHYF